LTRTCKVFAYGSNLAVARIEERVGPVAVVTTGWLDGHVLCFHKVGRDGSGKANAFFTGNRQDVVYGAVYEMPVAAKSKLDRFEGLGVDYLEKPVVITSAAGGVVATAYHAHPSRIDPSLLPFDWYQELVIDGARRHRLPDWYIEKLTAQATCVDPDVARAARARQLVALD
jgi:hypothetical protein